MAYVEPGTDFCLNCGETVKDEQDCSRHCRLVGVGREMLFFEPDITKEQTGISQYRYDELWANDGA